jgi:hypothetical protein
LLTAHFFNGVMPAGVVYDGVGGGGTLFQGMKLFLAQRLPMRGRWVDSIKVWCLYQY